MSSEPLPYFQKLLANERSFDRLFCDVAHGNGFDLYYNERFKDDPVFNHAVIDNSILSQANHPDADPLLILLHEVRTEAGRHNVPPTIFVEEFWENARFFQKVAIEDGYVVGGSMEILSKTVGPKPYSATEAIVIETNNLKTWNDVFMSSYAIPLGWEEELTRREQMFATLHSTKLLVAMDARRKPVGCILTHLMPPDCLGIYCVGTIPEMRHHGVARDMLHKAESLADYLGCKYLALQTISSDGVTPMYLRLGFKLEFKRNVLLVP